MSCNCNINMHHRAIDGLHTQLKRINAKDTTGGTIDIQTRFYTVPMLTASDGKNIQVSLIGDSMTIPDNTKDGLTKMVIESGSIVTTRYTSREEQYITKEQDAFLTELVKAGRIRGLSVCMKLPADTFKSSSLYDKFGGEMVWNYAFSHNRANNLFFTGWSGMDTPQASRTFIRFTYATVDDNPGRPLFEIYDSAVAMLGTSGKPTINQWHYTYSIKDADETCTTKTDIVSPLKPSLTAHDVTIKIHYA